MAITTVKHAGYVEERLDALFVSGWVFISWSELYHWYGQTKITKALYRDLLERWHMLLDSEKLRLGLQSVTQWADPVVVEKGYGGGILLVRPDLCGTTLSVKAGQASED